MLILQRRPGDAVHVRTPCGLVTIRVGQLVGDVIILEVDAPRTCKIEAVDRAVGGSTSVGANALVT